MGIWVIQACTVVTRWNRNEKSTAKNRNENNQNNKMTRWNKYCRKGSKKLTIIQRKINTAKKIGKCNRNNKTKLQMFILYVFYFEIVEHQMKTIRYIYNIKLCTY